jgi:drug/metabolite transporter (DMT)-like permease
MSKRLTAVFVLLIGRQADFSAAFALPTPNKVVSTISFFRSPIIHRNGEPLSKRRSVPICIQRDALKRRPHQTGLCSSTAIVTSATSPNVYLLLLALQFACQPLLTKAFTPPNIVRSTVVMAQDVMKILLSCIILLLTGSWGASIQRWTLTGALLGAGIPSLLYVIQNYCTLLAYQNLPPITFNVLNQTKTLSAALCCFLIMGTRQSSLQVLSLLLLLTSALVIEKVIPLFPWQLLSQEARQSQAKRSPDSIAMGVVPVLVSSFLSGLGTSSKRLTS